MIKILHVHKINGLYIMEKNNPILVFSFQIVELNTDEMVKPAPTCKYKFLVLEEPIILHIKKKTPFFKLFREETL